MSLTSFIAADEMDTASAYVGDSENTSRVVVGTEVL